MIRHPSTGLPGCHPQRLVDPCCCSQVLDFSRSVLEDLSNFDVSGAWPVLLDEFVESLQARGAWHRFVEQFPEDLVPQRTSSVSR